MLQSPWDCRLSFTAILVPTQEPGTYLLPVSKQPLVDPLIKRRGHLARGEGGNLWVWGSGSQTFCSQDSFTFLRILEDAKELLLMWLCPLIC